MEYHDFKGVDRELSKEDKITRFTIGSRKQVLEDEKFHEIFGEYKEAIGINIEPDMPEWSKFTIKYEELKQKQLEKELIEKKEEERRIQ